MLLDLNARRAARAAKNKEPFTINVGEETFTLVSELPLRVVELVGDGDLVAACKAMVVDEKDWVRFAELVNLIDVSEILSMYGTTMGESSASTESSENGGESSGQTSVASTPSTSPTAAGASEPTTS